VAAGVEAVRRSLTTAEADRFRTLGRDAAQGLTEACGALEPAWSEFEAAADVSSALVERGIDPVVLLVAGEERLPHHRHPLATGAPLGRLAMLVACARRGGLIASLTRFVSFGPLDPRLAEAYERLLEVDVAFIAATEAGARVGDVFARGIAAYETHGFARDEWMLHHQGGPTGYEPRDYLADAGSDARVEERQAFAWNPSVPSLKSEDTILAGGEILTVDPGWPTARIGELERPLVLER
jgi:Xaa-Pro aminopeptidase